MRARRGALQTRLLTHVTPVFRAASLALPLVHVGRAFLAGTQQQATRNASHVRQEGHPTKGRTCALLAQKGRSLRVIVVTALFARLAFSPGLIIRSALAVW